MIYIYIYIIIYSYIILSHIISSINRYWLQPICFSSLAAHPDPAKRNNQSGKHDSLFLIMHMLIFVNIMFQW